MAHYIVHVRGEGEEALDRAVFVRDGYSWLALLFGPLWFLAKGAWIAALVTALCVAFVSIILLVSGLSLLLPSGLFLINWLFALESGALRSWDMRQQGYRDIALVSGDDPELVEQRFFAQASGDSEAPPPLRAEASPVITSPVLGLFPDARRGGRP